MILAERVILDTGTRSIIPSIPGLDMVPTITAETWLADTGEWASWEWKGIGAFFDLHAGDRIVTKAGRHFHPD